MNPNEYQKEAQRTALFKYPQFDSALGAAQQNIIHAHFGMSTETGEIGDAIKTHFIYGQDLDRSNIVEECGDLMWYIALMLTACGYSMEECMRSNIYKLKLRYPEKFTEQDALERKDKCKCCGSPVSDKGLCDCKTVLD